MLRAKKKEADAKKSGTGEEKLENFMHLLIQTHELGDSSDTGATRRDSLIDRRRTTAAT